MAEPRGQPSRECRMIVFRFPLFLAVLFFFGFFEAFRVFAMAPS
jgi:hypothetical protein